MTATADILGPDGSFARSDSRFESRPQQVAMAEAVEAHPLNTAKPDHWLVTNLRLGYNPI
jgi:hypothetical protein